MKIDAFSHVRPQAYDESVERILGKAMPPGLRLPQLWDAAGRVRDMDEAGVDLQVITHTVPPIEQTATDPDQAAALAVASNNAVLDMAGQFPDRFIPIGTVALNNVDAAVREAERCLKTLGMKGILIYTNANGKPLHDPELQPFFEYMNGQSLPIWIHPYYNPNFTYVDWGFGFNPNQVFGWPFDTVIAMTCLIFGGVLDRYPNLKFITHHAGASIPFFEQRIATHPGPPNSNLKQPILDYYRRFYVDSAVQGSVGAMTASHAFYGASQILLGTDVPYASVDGKGNTKETIASIEALAIPPADKEQIFSGNLRRLLGL